MVSVVGQTPSDLAMGLHRSGVKVLGTSAIRHMNRLALEVILELESLGLPFSRTPEGRIYQRALGGQSLKFGEGGQAYRCAAAADRTDHAIRHALYGMALEFDGRFFVGYSALGLTMSDDGKRRGCIALCMEDGSVHRVGVHSTTIGQAGELDYSGSRAVKALRESGVRSVLIDPTSPRCRRRPATRTACTSWP